MKRKKTTSPYITIRKSSIHSWGGFARKDIPKEARVIEYVGDKLTKAKANRRGDIPWERHQKDKGNGAVYLFELNNRYDLDGNVSYNTARYINHSCDPNCETDIIAGRVWIIALRDIKQGEEITYNYGYRYEDYEEHPCHCKTGRCMGFILAEEEWPKLKRKLTRLKNHKKNGKHAQAHARRDR